MVPTTLQVAAGLALIVVGLGWGAAELRRLAKTPGTTLVEALIDVVTGGAIAPIAIIALLCIGAFLVVSGLPIEAWK